MPDSEQIEFTADQPGERLDKILVTHVGERLTRSQLQALIKDGQVTVNGVPVKPGVKLKGGETIRLTVPATPRKHVGLARADCP